jgi:hypothetical protein
MVTHDTHERWNDSHYTLTTIDVQGEPQSCFEVFAESTKAQTLGFVFDQRVAELLAIVHAADKMTVHPMRADREPTPTHGQPCACCIILRNGETLDSANDPTPKDSPLRVSRIDLCPMHKAAPAMLEALRDLMKSCENWAPTIDRSRARAAIAQAERGR